jgi:DNA-binding NarL/FixJ family response regulator
MLTMFEDDDSVFAAMRAGVHGSVLKGADGAATLRAIRAVANGEAIFSPSIARRLTGYFSTPGGEPKTSSVQASEESAYRTSENSPSTHSGE